MMFAKVVRLAPLFIGLVLVRLVRRLREREGRRGVWVGGFRNFLNSELWVCARGDVRVPSPLCVAALRPSRQNASAPFGAAVCAHRACKREGEDNLWRHHTLGLHLTPLDAPCGAPPLPSLRRAVNTFKDTYDHEREARPRQAASCQHAGARC